MPQKSILPKVDWLAATQGQGPSQQSDSAKWAEMTDLPLFKQCTERALTEYVVRLEPDPTQLGAMALKVQGAKEVLKVLLNLAEPERGTQGAVQTKGLIPT